MVSHRLVQNAKIVLVDCRFKVIGSKDCFGNLECPLIKRLRSFEFSLFVIEQANVIYRDGSIAVFRSK